MCSSLIASVKIGEPPDVLHMCQEASVDTQHPQTQISHHNVTESWNTSLPSSEQLNTEHVNSEL